MTKIIKVDLGERTYPIIIQPGILGRIGDTLKRKALSVKRNEPSNRFIIITDNNVASIYLNKVIASLKRTGFKSLYKILPTGETQKSLATANKIYDFLVKHKIERNDIIIALGGGVVGDLAGFVAGTYKRGLGLIQVPTSLIAQADSSIGGKTAVNLDSGKNLVGLFYQPELVLIDPLLLKSLPEKEFCNGMAEVIKTALIKDKKLFEMLRDKHKEIINLNPNVLETILARAIRIKVNIIEQDEKDTKGQRILLNYGHTIGHILEASGKYKHYKHGEAISIGMMFSAKIAQRMKLVGYDFVKTQSELLKMYHLPTMLKKQIDLSEMISFLHQDKKIKGGKISEVLPNRIGSASIYNVPLSIIRNAFIE
ncbi:MAG: 3-dehydroquinate synthase [Planctomycetota bacterium]